MIDTLIVAKLLILLITVISFGRWQNSILAGVTCLGLILIASWIKDQS